MGYDCKKCTDKDKCKSCGDLKCSDVLAKIDAIFIDTIEKTGNYYSSVISHDQLVSVDILIMMTQSILENIFEECMEEVMLVLALSASGRGYCSCECVLESILSVNAVVRAAKVNISKLAMTKATNDPRCDPFYQNKVEVTFEGIVDPANTVVDLDDVQSVLDGELLLGLDPSTGVTIGDTVTPLNGTYETDAGDHIDYDEFADFLWDELDDIIGMLMMSIEMLMLYHHVTVKCLTCDSACKATICSYLNSILDDSNWYWRMSGNRTSNTRSTDAAKMITDAQSSDLKAIKDILKSRASNRLNTIVVKSQNARKDRAAKKANKVKPVKAVPATTVAPVVAPVVVPVVVPVVAPVVPTPEPVVPAQAPEITI